MKILYTFMAIVSCSLLICWIFLKKRNMRLVKQYNCKPWYKEYKRFLRKKPLLIVTLIINISLLELTLSYGLGCIVINMILWCISYGTVINFNSITFDAINFAILIFYSTVYLWFFRGIYMNLEIHKQIKQFSNVNYAGYQNINYNVNQYNNKNQ